ncbi:EAL domain-containing protein [Salinisphaera sp. Q1T1-3]|uniref:EAL domain-containing protein n=1 Tax=Salinisphaera sp. Q1T1-3 TaxID=2321229 RepID=UPI000E74906C|nr:EAL domain-containing protein [Salinisphaera sp. Q1T1-3]RJS95078.1 EAL domain-containing protein [Salinisphaera sp. Q1T1-3]
MTGRIRSWVASGLLCVQLVALVGMFWAPTTWRPVSLALVVICGLAGMLLFVIDQHSQAQRRHDDAHRLAYWLADIDLDSQTTPRLTCPIGPDAQALADAATRLVVHVQDYREKLLQRHQRIQRLLRNVTDVLYHADAQGRIRWISDSVTDMLGYSPRELQDYPLEKLLADPAHDLRHLLDSERIERRPIRVIRRDGSYAWLLVSVRRLDNAAGVTTGSEGICRDGTRLIETQRQLDVEKERAQVTLAALGDGVVTTDSRGMVDFANPAAQQILMSREDQLVGRHFDEVCKLQDAEQNQPVTGLIDEVLDSGVTRDPTRTLRVKGEKARRESRRWVTINVSPIHASADGAEGTVVVLRDVTRLYRVSRELTYQANHDSLTGLLNRRAFEQQLSSIIENVGRENRRHALCYIDLDQFKLVNDSCGHHAGDAMLRQLASRIGAELRGGDILARLGGDEFGLIMKNTTLETAEHVAERLRVWIEGFRFHWQGRIFRLGASIGLVVIEADSVSAAELLRQADTACYVAKERGRNHVQVYQPDSDEARMRDYDIERMQQISEALEHTGFKLFAQPIYPLGEDTSQLGLELLLRLGGDGQDAGSPQNLLLAAERYSMAPRIDRWVIEHALDLISHRQNELTNIGYYSINISGQSITDEQFIGFVRECIETSGVDPRRLVFEITETAAVTNLQRAGELMRSLRLLGCRFALDDFGSGLSSFSYLKHLPSDFVKIDGKLVSRMLEDPVEHSIIEAIGRVSNALGLLTVAEHVESREQFSALKQIGIDNVQGYYVGRPLPFEQIQNRHTALV